MEKEKVKDPSEFPSSDEHIPPEIQEEEVKYLLEVSKGQLSIIKAALEMYARIGCGQTSVILDHPKWRAKLLEMGPETLLAIDKLTRDLEGIGSMLTGKPRRVYIGIPIADAPSRVAYDIFQVIAHHLAWAEHPEGGHGVDFNEPLQLAAAELPKVFTKEKPNGKVG